MDWWLKYTIALVLTILVETLLACVLRYRQARRLVVDVPLMNLFTHPLLHIVRGFGVPLVVGELCVMAVEACIYRSVTRLSLTWSLVLGIGLNAVTWVLGYVLLQAL